VCGPRTSGKHSRTHQAPGVPPTSGQGWRPDPERARVRREDRRGQVRPPEPWQPQPRVEGAHFPPSESWEDPRPLVPPYLADLGAVPSAREAAR
jgi:hypothetical protein